MVEDAAQDSTSPSDRMRTGSRSERKGCRRIPSRADLCNPRRSLFPCILGRDRLPYEAAGGMIDATAGVHRGARWRGGVAADGARATAGDAGDRVARRGTGDGGTHLPWFNQGLAETGYIVGRNVTITSREGDRDRLPALTADLVRQHVTVIAVVGVTAAQVAKAATQTIPVVFGMSGDPVEVGVVASLNRPSGNVTGATAIGAELAGKRLELLHKLVPGADTIAMLVRQGRSAFIQAETRAMQSAADVLGVRLLVLYAATESEVAPAFATLIEHMPAHW
jgi:ABC transporter substrate binding protein